jgi:hypothetical protein
MRKPTNEKWRICYNTAGHQKNLLDDQFIGCDTCLNSYETAEKKLISLADLEKMSREHYIKDKDRRNELIRTFRKHSTLSMKEIGKLFGGLTESSVCKILNDCN